MSYKHCENCKHCKKDRWPHKNFVTDSWNILNCNLKHKYIDSSVRIRAVFCRHFENKGSNNDGI